MTVNYHGILTLEIIGFLTAVIYHGKLPQYFYNIGPWSQCYKTFIYCHSTVKSSFRVIKQNYHGNYLGMEVNTQVL
jgi:hypothetical protein